MSKFEESNFYKALQDFFINADKKTFLQFLAEFYNRTEGIIDKNNIQDDLLKELRELYLEFNEKGIDENIVREKVNYFLENNVKIKDIITKLSANTNKIEDVNTKLNVNTNNIENINSQMDNNVRELDVKKANQSDLIIERKRIDNLSKLNEGSTTGDAELIDGRIGINGVNYNNIGGAIREQVKNSISSNKITTLFTFNNSFNGGLFKSAMCLFKAQTVQVCIEDTNGVLDNNGIFAFGVIDLEGNQINNLCKIKVNEIGEFTVPTDIKEIVFWVGANLKVSNGDVNLIIKHKQNIYEDMSSLRGKITTLKSEINNSNISNLNFSIIGDSYSTYKKWINDAYLPWYTDEGNTKDNNVTSVKQTWWWKLSNETGMTLLTNSSYSGSTICNTWYNSEDISGTDKSFLTRIKKDIGENNTLKNKPNIIFIFGGINDKWAKSPVGSVKYDSWSNDDLKKVLPAFCYLIDYLKLWNPQARIINIVNDLLSDEIKNGMIQACNYYNIENLILTNIEKENDHPNINGMERIKQQIKEIL